VQERPDIWLGGASVSVRQIVSDLADGWTPAAPQGDGLTPATFGAALREIRQNVSDGRHIVGGALFYAVVDDSKARVQETMSMLRRRADWSQLSDEDFRRKAIVLAGPSKSLVETIKEYESEGLEHITLAFLPLDDLERTRTMLTRVADEVLPEFS
jgi:alkanesulfonate monooxygenase SsuD/methylene tetrahydromethanopterin reductase-like flavin-dependent oxidoreductase (luciferase family)